MIQTVTMTLTDFLLARIAEDEAWARSPEFDHGDPDRMLAECEAKRSLLALHAITNDGRCGECSDTYSVTPWDGLCDVARRLAPVYADHPDYDAAWKP